MKKQFHNYFQTKKLHRIKIKARGIVNGMNFKKELIRRDTKNIIKNNKILLSKKCEKCGTKENLHLHHEKYTLNPLDWKVLCASCHMKLHKNKFKKILEKESKNLLKSQFYLCSCGNSEMNCINNFWVCNKCGKKYKTLQELKEAQRK